MTLQDKPFQYRQFTDAHRINGEYSASRGAASIIGCVAPMKAALLSAMEPGKEYETENKLFKEVKKWFAAYGFGEPPITRKAFWSYIEIARNGIITPGSLTKAGLTESTGLGYAVTPARELILPVIRGAAEFTAIAREKIKFYPVANFFRDGNTAVTHNTLILRIVEYLAENKGPHGFTEIGQYLNLPDSAACALSEVIKFLGEIEVIKCASPLREIEGERPKDWGEYRFSQMISFPEVRAKVRKSRPNFTDWELLTRVYEFGAKHPEMVLAAGFLQKRLQTSEKRNSQALAALRDVGVLTQEYGLPGTKYVAVAEGTDVTSILYNTLVKPALETAATLLPAQIETTPDHVALFFKSYETRTHTSLDEMIRTMLKSSGRLKLSDVPSIVNQQSPRYFGRANCFRALQKLVKRGEAAMLGNGWYAPTSATCNREA